MDEEIGTFCSFTGATPEQAQRFLALTDNNVEQAVELFFNSPDLGAAPAAAAPPARAPAPPAASSDAPITIDDDDDEVDDFDDDDDVQMTGSRPVAQASHSVEDDEAMARRLQEEMYGARGGGGGGSGMGYDEDGVRAPMAARTETLIGPGSSDWRDQPGEMNAAIAHQLMNRHEGRRAAPGIFNQRESRSIWANDDPTNPAIHNEVLSRATGGASDQTSKANLLAELFRPPFDLISQQPFSAARDDGKENEKWIIVNVQDPSIFDCQVLNRDIWKNQSIRDTIKEHFIFLQYNKDDPRGQEYVNYYFSTMRDSEDAYPHIAIVDPRTGEQVKTWSGSPGPKPADFLMDLHEFLDRYSLKMEKKNPVQTKRKEAKKDVTRMSEEEQLELALQASLANGSSSGPKDEDPDALTKSSGPANGKGKAAESSSSAMDVDESASSTSKPSKKKEDTPFSLISATTPHTEPTDPKTTTRIQFRHSGGRVIRRFALDDPVRRIYEWLKSEPLAEGKERTKFELVGDHRRNLIGDLEVSIKQAGLSGGTVYVEYVEEEEEEGE